MTKTALQGLPAHLLRHRPQLGASRAQPATRVWVAERGGPQGRGAGLEQSWTVWGLGSPGACALGL